MSRPPLFPGYFGGVTMQDDARREFLDELGFDWGDDEQYLYFQWPELLVTFYSVMVRML